MPTKSALLVDVEAIARESCFSMYWMTESSDFDCVSTKQIFLSRTTSPRLFLRRKRRLSSISDHHGGYDFVLAWISIVWRSDRSGIDELEGVMLKGSTWTMSSHDCTMDLIREVFPEPAYVSVLIENDWLTYLYFQLQVFSFCPCFDLPLWKVFCLAFWYWALSIVVHCLVFLGHLLLPPRSTVKLDWWSRHWSKLIPHDVVI